MPRVRAALASGALGLALTFGSSEAPAQDAPAQDAPTLAPELAIPVELSACSDVDRAELLKLLAMEFQTLNVRAQCDSERVLITCSGARVRVTLEPAQDTTEVDLTDTATSAWPRLLALAVSELAIEARARIVAPARPPPPIKVEARPAPAPARRTPLRLFAGARFRRAMRAETNLWGPEIGLEMGLIAAVTLVAQARAEFAGSETPLARVRWTTEGGSVALLWDWHARAWTFGVGPGFSLDALRLTPSVTLAGASGRAVGGAWGGPELVARARYSLASALLAYADVDGGVVLLPVEGNASDGRRLVDAGGSWLGASAGVALQF